MNAPSSAQDADPTLEGVVTRSTGSWYHVQVGDRIVRSRIRGKFRLTRQDVTNPVAVGDRVSLRVNDEDGTGLILDIHDRTTKLSRRASGHRTDEEHVMVANVDRAWIMQSVRLPALNAAFVDRLLVAAAVNEIPAGVIINKMDLLTDEQRTAVMDFHLRYADLGYPVLPMSALHGKGIEPLKAELQDQMSVVTGPSGTGKSSLLNAIEPGLDVETGEVSESTSKGTHTTTHAELHSLSFGGYLVDTPGIREFGVRQVHPKDLAHFFPEMISYVNECKFPDCTHDHEPGCAIQAAVDRGEVHPARYDSYLRILESLQEEEEKRF
ncbi:MAG: ribosome small subunit-dependent GTPase A [Bacteroidetes bacterium SW_9_63_38]|nr:MAG: ribosome small subunit-dependent GTPase A [Bacteroidetes bacterium SW_9_63_38]